MTEHAIRIAGALQGRYFWVCSCGQSSEAGFLSELAAWTYAHDHRRGMVPAAGA